MKWAWQQVETSLSLPKLIALLNQKLPLIPQTAHQLPAYTVATRPSSPDGTVIYVSDGAAGARFQGRHGGAWVNLG